MGGAVKAIAKAVGLAPKAPTPPPPAPVAPAAAKAEATSAAAQTAAAKVAKQATLGAGYGASTVMTSARGVEEEASTAKTVLGGTSTAGRRRRKSAYGAA
jgi:hypothetical protein